MPKPRDIVGLKTTPEQRREAIVRKAVKVHQPYRVFDQSKIPTFTTTGWCLIYVEPFTGERQMIRSDIKKKAKAVKLKEFAEQAWVAGLRSSITE